MNESLGGLPEPHNPEAIPPERTLEQMVNDIRRYDTINNESYGLIDDYALLEFRELFGYTDPRITALQQDPQYRLTGHVSAARTTEQMAYDIYDYERQLKRAASGDRPSVPSFEEYWGYSDPRQVSTEGDARKRR